MTLQFDFKAMEVPSRSDVQYVGEADCAQQSFGRIDELPLNVDRPQIEGLGKRQEVLDALPILEGHQSGTSYSACQIESQRLPYDSHEFEDDDLNEQNYSSEPCLAAENSHIIVDTIESELPTNYGDGESSLSEPNWLEHDESVAVWVKWRGKWQAGIRCSRADWPLPTLKAKPTHDRKKYFVIFFPNTRNYSWADMQLVRSINEFPHPIAYRTYKVGLKMVKDLTVARRFVMKKLAVGMLNIVEQFHTEAFVETARDVVVWKEFAMETSRCSGYPDLGRMLLKLQNMISKSYINSDWLQRSLQSWVQRCQGALSAESIELLKEELYDSILWNEVKSLWDAPVQPTLWPEWKTWKHEVMKWFSTSHPISSGGETEQRNSDDLSAINPQVNRKRPKLEVRRAETHASLVESVWPPQPMPLEIDSTFFNDRGTVNTATLSSEVCEEDVKEGAAPIESPCTVADRWDEIVVEPRNHELVIKNDVELTPVNEVLDKKLSNSGSKNRQCTAFIESKGRQCVRWANEGDVYCCVHLASRFIGSSAKAEGTPVVHTQMCEGTTVLGTKCKHRSLPGFSFCKKHRPRNESNNVTTSPERAHKRKHEETVHSMETTYCKDIVLTGEVETPLLVEPLSVMGVDTFHGGNNSTGKLDCSSNGNNRAEIRHCIGLSPHDTDPCRESPKRYALYCDRHLPSWLKRARNGKSRIISKEVFIDLLRDCGSRERKLQLHQACELFYKLFKSILSLRNPVPMEIQLQWALSEASKDFGIGELFLKLVCSEKERLRRIWSFSVDEDMPLSPSVEGSMPLQLAVDGSYESESSIKCKICSQEFLDDQQLGSHWMDNHKKEAQWLFRGYACAICLDSFTNRKVLETHVQERHHVQFVEQCMLLQCIPCGSHFGNPEELWLHVLSVHPVDLRQSKDAQQHDLALGEDSPQKVELSNAASMAKNITANLGNLRKFVCKFCGLKFDLLPDLGRHHQAAHMGPNLFSSRPPKKGVRFYAYRLKSGRLSRPRFKKGLGTASYRIRNRNGVNLKKRIQASKSLSTIGLSNDSNVIEAASLGSLAESQCSSIANKLISEIQKTKPRPNNLDILAIVRSACCKVNLKATLEGKYGVLPDRLYLKAAKLCSEHNIRVEWHQEDFICPRGCGTIKDREESLPLPNAFTGHQSADESDDVNNEWEVDECHYVIDLEDIRDGPLQKVTILCDDISFGKESIPIACVVDEGSLDRIFANGSDGQTRVSLPWESFNYVTKPLLEHSLGLDSESLQLGCACPRLICCPEACGHVYLFDNDYEDAKDVYGKPMHGRFPYDDKGRIILEEGYLVYECNQMCRCNRTCPNRILQNGVRVKLEVFKTENKGWAVRAGEPILRGTFVCEYIGEVVDEREAKQRRNRYGKEGCSYMYIMDAHSNDMSRLIEGQDHYIIDATKYGNVSRFVNHSCSPNLVNYQVLVDSMECQRAHLGLYASRDIAFGEELTYDYRYELHPGEGHPCYCGASKCRGRLR
ncbi:histone-lysine N-methyltransferase SUVR5 isoform X1 [Tripterygium wilfordii]|uniref:histone-lysine N-methyltransferase SUVR5 isoform X1 n=2 Tax=Tripterygium wilfordii TaxID=458696 RepID=UPI0018F8024F|nr:histone-lysine N-methyltransferase SUVR5 isoform X1 [Tripterygium wilfordii]